MILGIVSGGLDLYYADPAEHIKIMRVRTYCRSLQQSVDRDLSVRRVHS